MLFSLKETLVKSQHCKNYFSLVVKMEEKELYKNLLWNSVIEGKNSIT